MSDGIRERISVKRMYLVALTLLMVTGFVSAVGQQPAPAAQTSQMEHFALLIGVNDYEQPSDNAYRVPALKGPSNDLALIKGLLLKYGFKDDQKHILTLLGNEASHAGIEKAFKTQLIDNASKSPNAIFVF